MNQNELIERNKALILNNLLLNHFVILCVTSISFGFPSQLISITDPHPKATFSPKCRCKNEGILESDPKTTYFKLIKTR